MNLFSYIEWRGDLPMSTVPLCPMDALILCRLAYCPMEGAVPAEFNGRVKLRDAAKVILESPQGRRFLLENDKQLLEELSEHERFAQLEMCGYCRSTDAAAEKQFSAVTVFLGDGRLFIAYRGTDATLVGWKEDFNMSFCRVPSQLEAVHYLKAAALPGHRLVCAGHSKGGNLAVYAAAFSGKRLKNRIDSVYDFDGPGFIKEITADPQYLEIAPRIHKFVPQSSVIGRLLAAGEKSVAVMSDERGLRQHDLYSWRVVPPGEMERAESLNLEFVGNMLNDWISGMDIEERKSFFDTCYMVLSSSDAVTLSELSGRKSVMKILRTLKQTDPETRRLILRGFALLTRSVREHLPAALRREQNIQAEQSEESKEHAEACAYGCTCAAEEKGGAENSTASEK